MGQELAATLQSIMKNRSRLGAGTDLSGQAQLGAAGRAIQSYSSLGYQGGGRPSGVRSSTFHSGIRSGAPRGSWPGSGGTANISPAQKCRIVPSRRVNPLKAGVSPSSGLT